VRSWGSLLIGAMGLAVLDAVVSHTQSAENVGGFLAGLGNAVNRFVSPAIPAFSTAVKTTANTTPPALLPVTDVGGSAAVLT
jgi:hypothetical protein